LPAENTAGVSAQADLAQAKSSEAAEAKEVIRAAGDNLDCVTTNFNRNSSNLNRKIQLRHNASGERPDKSLIDFGFARNVKVIGSSD